MFNLLDFFCNFCLHFFCFGDEISDIYYLIKNKQYLIDNRLFQYSYCTLLAHWSLVALFMGALMKSKQIKLIDFFCFQPVIFIIGVMANTDKFLLKILLFLILVIITPVWGLFIIGICWSKMFFVWNKKCQQSDQMSTLNIKMFQIFVLMTELIIQNIPQMIIQIINNNMSQIWDSFQIVSVALSAFILGTQTMRVIYFCKAKTLSDVE